MDSGTYRLLDLDHVVMKDNRIYRVLGNLASRSHFLGYNVYSPHPSGDRLYRGKRYKKNFTEEDHLPADVLDTYELLPKDHIAEHRDPIQSAISDNTTFQGTIWFALYAELVRTFDEKSVGVFGSSMFGLHKTPEGAVRKDIDFVVQGINNVPVLREQLPKIREKLGFTTVTPERQLQQYARYQRIFRNEHNSIDAIIARRWTGLQLSPSIVSTIRLRDRTVVTPLELVASSTSHDDNAELSGMVINADTSNLFPRRFTLVTNDDAVDVYIFWWKFSTPVRDGDKVTLCGSLVTSENGPTVRLTNFTQHWLSISN